VIKDAAPIEARFTILEENKSCQQIIIHFKEHGDCNFSETFVCAQIWKHRADEHLTSRLQDSPGKNTNPALDQYGWGIQAYKHYSYPVSWHPEEELNSGSSIQAREKRETACKRLGHSCREECGTNLPTSRSIDSRLSRHAFFPNSSKTCAPLSYVYNLNLIFVNS